MLVLPLVASFALAPPAEASTVEDWEAVWEAVDSSTADACRTGEDLAACVALSPMVSTVTRWLESAGPMRDPYPPSFIGHLQLSDVMTTSVSLDLPSTDTESTTRILDATWRLGRQAQRTHPGYTGLVLRQTIELQVLDAALEHGLDPVYWGRRARDNVPSRARVDRAMRTTCDDQSRVFARAQPTSDDTAQERIAGWFYDADPTRTWLTDACLVQAGVIDAETAATPTALDGFTNPVGVMLWLEAQAIGPNTTARALTEELSAQRQARVRQFPKGKRNRGCHGR